MPRIAKNKTLAVENIADKTTNGVLPVPEVTGIIKRTLNSAPEIEFVSVGFGSSVAMQRVLAVLAPDTAPVRRLIQEARDKGLLLDATHGRKTKAVLVLDTGHVLAAALQPETIIGRFKNQREAQ